MPSLKQRVETLEKQTTEKLYAERNAALDALAQWVHDNATPDELGAFRRWLVTSPNCEHPDDEVLARDGFTRADWDAEMVAIGERRASDEALMQSLDARIPRHLIQNIQDTYWIAEWQQTVRAQ